LIGQRRTVIIGGVLMAIGHFLMAFEAMFLVALLLLILGIGAFKPNISTQVGALYPPGDRRRDRAYSIFYVGINIGAFLAPLVCGALAAQYGWHYGFGAAGIGMLVSLAIYLHGTRMLPPDVAAGRRPALETTPLAPPERRAVRMLVGVCALVTLFWAAYDQQGNTIMLWAEDLTDRSIDLMFWQGEVPSPWFLALNPLMISPAHAGHRAAVGATRRARRRAVPCQQNGVRQSMRRARQRSDGRGRSHDRGQGEHALAGRLFPAGHDRRASLGAGRARADLQARPGPAPVGHDGRVVRVHAAGRHSRRLPRWLLEQHGEVEFLPADRCIGFRRRRRAVGVPEIRSVP
jgi:hypothetical protein